MIQTYYSGGQGCSRFAKSAKWQFWDLGGYSWFFGISGGRLPRVRAAQRELRDATCRSWTWDTIKKCKIFVKTFFSMRKKNVLTIFSVFIFFLSYLKSSSCKRHRATPSVPPVRAANALPIYRKIKKTIQIGDLKGDLVGGKWRFWLLNLSGDFRSAKLWAKLTRKVKVASKFQKVKSKLYSHST